MNLISASATSVKSVVQSDLNQENPFSTRFTRPGEIPFLFAAGESADDVLARWTKSRWRGAIVGPHGSGKSTLVAELLPQLEAMGRRPRVVALHDGQLRLPADFTADLQADEVLVVDGYEQLGWPARWSLHRAVRRSGAGLLITSHQVTRGVPTLIATQATLAATTALVQQLVAAMPEAVITQDDVRRSFERKRGNVREVFFELYDLYELRRL